MNWPPQQPPFPQQPQPQQPYPGQPNAMGPTHGVPPLMVPQQPNIAVAAAQNTFAAMLAAPARQRVNREKPGNGTHIVQFTRESKMDTSQKDMQPYLLLVYQVIQSTAPQMVNKTYSMPLTFAHRGSIQALAELAKVVFGADGAMRLSAANPMPFQIAQHILAHVVNAQTGQGLFALLNTWRNTRAQPGKPIPTYEEAFVNHDWKLMSQTVFTFDQAAAAGHQISVGAPPPPLVMPGAQPGPQWGAPAPVPAQQWQPQPQAQPMPQAQPQQFPQQQFAPPQQQPPQQQFAPPANVVPQQAPPPQVHFPSAQPGPASFPPPPGFPPRQ
jgi:hypothetical protein